MTGVGGDTGRGLRVASRGFRTWWKLSWKVVTFVFFAGLATAVWKTISDYTNHDWHVVGVYALCEFMLVAGFDPDKIKTIRDLDGTVEVETISFIADFGPILDLRDRMVGDALDGALIGGGSGLGLAAAVLFGLRLFGRRLRRGRRLRGGELATAEELRHRTMPLWRTMMLQLRGPEAAPYTVAGIPWPKKAETLHTIVSGTTGSGKTVLISDLVEQIRSRGERCIVYDKMGSYTETFFDRDRDILLNPLDDRSPRWSPFLEARTDRDFDTMAHALIPKQKDAADPFWITAARQLFSRGAAVLWKQGETRNRVLLDLLLKTELTELAKAMADTETQSIVDPENPKTALSVRAMLTANIGTMDLLPDEGGAFSIREWIEHDGDGCLFLTSRGDQHASLRGLISTWLEIAVNSLLSLPHRDDRRMWVILDELPTLHQLPSLESGLSETRQWRCRRSIEARPPTNRSNANATMALQRSASRPNLRPESSWTSSWSWNSSDSRPRACRIAGFGTVTFADVATDPACMQTHHRMLMSYALHDQRGVPDVLGLRGDEHVIDAGGGLGALAGLIVEGSPGLRITVLDSPEATERARHEDRRDGKAFQAADLFRSWGVVGDAVILARILHDWDDASALLVLDHARRELSRGGRLFVVEMYCRKPDRPAGFAPRTC